MPQDDLISYRIEGNYRWRFLGEIRIGNVDDRPESVIREIGAEDDRFHVRADAQGINGDIRSAIQGGFNLVDDLVAVDRGRPTGH